MREGWRVISKFLLWKFQNSKSPKQILQIVKHLGKSLLSRTSQAPRFLAPDIDIDDHDVDSNGNDFDHDLKGQDVDYHDDDVKGQEFWMLMM